MDVVFSRRGGGRADRRYAQRQRRSRSQLVVQRNVRGQIAAARQANARNHLPRGRDVARQRNRHVRGARDAARRVDGKLPDGGCVAVDAGRYRCRRQLRRANAAVGDRDRQIGRKRAAACQAGACVNSAGRRNSARCSDITEKDLVRNTANDVRQIASRARPLVFG